MSLRYRFGVRSFLFIMMALLLSGGVRADQSQKGLPEENLRIFSSLVTHEFSVEVASTDRQRAFGLMFQEQLSPEQGMLFVFEAEGELSFWMKNTPLPLDIIFIDSAGIIVNIAADTVPYSLSTLSSEGDAQYVLEINAGLAQKLDIRVGDQVVSPSIEKRQNQIQ